MSAISAFTLAEAREMLTLYKEALKELLTGQAKHYRIGTREFTALDAEELQEGIEFFSNLIEALSGQVRTSRVVRVVPRDL